ncbi:hypothetical protein RJ641_024434 [Dillenia turbinata]|uniref:Uncharacterized protein n=1 Tax=Dillenia turbinata TaxID=194707 RepID=A0AAN8WCF9_9MAGN
MAYRRRQGITRASTFKEEIVPHPPSQSQSPEDERAGDIFSNSNSISNSSSSPSSNSLAAQAIRASAAHRDSSLSSAYASDPFYSLSDRPPSSTFKGSDNYEYTSLKTSNDSKYGFWGVLARKAKAILEDENVSQQFETSGRTRMQTLDSSTGDQFYQPYRPQESNRRMDNPRLQKGLDAITSKLNYIGDTLGNAFEEGRTIVENKTADIIQETRKLQIRRKGSNSDTLNVAPSMHSPWQQPVLQSTQGQPKTNHETQLKASRDVAMATAAKAKLLLRELKTVKADLAFAKARCTQLEEENKILRESCEKGDNPADDDLIRLQLETLLAEKARLTHENSLYARENRFLREIVEYHQLTMQDVVYIDEGMEEVQEVYPFSIPEVSKMLSESPSSPSSPYSPEAVTSLSPPPATAKETPAKSSQGKRSKVLGTETSDSTIDDIPIADDSERYPESSS